MLRATLEAQTRNWALHRGAGDEVPANAEPVVGDGPRGFSGSPCHCSSSRSLTTRTVRGSSGSGSGPGLAPARQVPRSETDAVFPTAGCRSAARGRGGCLGDGLRALQTRSVTSLQGILILGAGRGGQGNVELWAVKSAPRPGRTLEWARPPSAEPQSEDSGPHRTVLGPWGETLVQSLPVGAGGVGVGAGSDSLPRRGKEELISM